MASCLHLLAACVILLRAYGATIAASINLAGYHVFVTEGPLVPALAFSAPRAGSAVLQLSNHLLPQMLCGASILSVDSLIASIRCAPSVASRTEVYVFPANTTHFLANLAHAHVLQHVVTRVAFKSEYTTTSGKKLRNVAVLQLNSSYFAEDQHIFTSTSTPEHHIEATSAPQSALKLTQEATKQIITEAPFIEENYEILDYQDYVDFDENPAQSTTTSQSGPHETTGGSNGSNNNDLASFLTSTIANIDVNIPSSPNTASTWRPNNNSNDTQITTDDGDNTAAGLPDKTQITPEDLLGLTTVLIDVVTEAHHAQHPNTSESPLSGDMMTTTPPCTLREEYERRNQRIIRTK